MYKIVFHFYRGSHETYAGNKYVFQGEKYAVFNNEKPKLYKNAKIAANSAEKLLHSCVNCIDSFKNYEIVEVSHGEL